MDYGQGTLRRVTRKTSKNAWMYRFFHKDQYGRRKQLSFTVYATTKRDAWTKAFSSRDKFIADLNAVANRKQARLLGDLWEEYIEDASAHLGYVTVKGYNAAWNTAYKMLHKIPAKELTTQQLKDAVHEYKTTPIRKGKRINKYPSNRSQQRSYTTLGTFLKWCVFEDYLDVNPLDKVRRAKLSEAERMPPATFTTDEFNAYLSACAQYDAVADQTPHFELLTYVARTTGMRLGEVLGLTFRAIDFDNYNIHVRQALSSNRSLKAPKAHSIRYITVNKDFIDQISEQLQKIDALQQQNKEYWHDNNLVFPDPVGNPLSPYTASARLSLIRKKLGLRKELSHKNLRHTFATELISNGFDIKTVQEIMGHKLSSTTEQYYQGLSNRSQGEVADFVQKNVLPLSKQQAIKEILN